MIFLLLFEIASLEEPEGLISMDRVLFRRYVEARNPIQPWLVAFIRNGSKKCSKCVPYLEQVASRSYGYMFVGTVDQDKEPLLVKDYGVKKNWTLFLFDKNGHHQITFSCDPQRYYRLLVDSLPNEVLDVDPTWLKTSKKKPSAILFTSQFKVPHMWRAISGYFKGILRIGLCTENDYFEKFQITRTPTVLYLNSSGQYQVRNVQDYKTMRSYLELMRKNRPLPIKPVIQRFFLSSDFNEECVDGTICVFHASKSIDTRFQLKETRFSDEKLRFFSGVNDLPYKFMKENDLWIFNGDRSGLIPVSDFQDLDEMIKFVLKGSIKWTPMSEYKIDDL